MNRAERRAAARTINVNTGVKIIKDAIVQAARNGCEWCGGPLHTKGNPQTDSKPSCWVEHRERCDASRLPYWVATGHPCLGIPDRDHPNITPPNLWQGADHDGSA